MPDDTRFNNGPIFGGLFFDMHRISDWCDPDSGNIFENSWSQTTGSLDGDDNRVGMSKQNYGTSLRCTYIHKVWYIRDIWFYYCDDGCCTAVVVDF